MSVPSTRDPQKNPVNQLVLKKVDSMNFDQVEVVREFQIAEARERKAICGEPCLKGSC
jgi:hypothetical protein